MYNGSVFFFDGRNGAVIWQYPFFPESGIADFMSLAMSADGLHVASGGPASGVLTFDSSGKVLWAGSVGGFGEPVFVLEADSLVLMYQPSGTEVELVRYNGTQVASFEGVSAMAGSPVSASWAAAGGQITKAGSCATLRLFDGPTELPSMRLC